MDLDELERRTHEQIRDIQDEYRQRIAPLEKILMDIHNCRPPRITLTHEQAEAFQRLNGQSITEAFYKK